MIIHKKLGRGQPLSLLWKQILILEELEHYKCWSKSELKRKVNMSDTTLSSPLNSLIESGLLTEETFNKNIPGRMNITYEITDKGRQVLKQWRGLLRLLGVEL